MRAPDKRFYDDDPEGYEAAWNRYEDNLDQLRDRLRDEAVERQDELNAKYAVEIAEDRQRQKQINADRRIDA